MEQAINRFNKCPNCNTNWDGGDIYEVLCKMDIHLNKSPEEMIKIASNYGWTPEEPRRFSLTNTIEIKTTPLVKDVYYECSSCKNIYHALTGKHYSSINKVKNVIQ